MNENKEVLEVKKVELPELSTYLNQPVFQSIINEEEFYFQKGQDALKQWMNFPVSDELKDTLIKLAKDYKGILELAKERNDVKEVLDLLFEVIAYCDNHARDKNSYNKYEDKRALADAFVRMNSWVEKIIQYRFFPDEVGAGSPKNAFDYLLDPIQNSTVLSENHRQQLSENFLKKPYNPGEFTKDLEDYFKPYNLKIINPQNYTHLLMWIVYSFQNKWREKKTASKLTDIIELVKSSLEEDPETKELFNFEKTERSYVWIKDKYQIIGNWIAHYEIAKRKDKLFVEVHFEGKKKEKDIFFRDIHHLPEKFEWFDWSRSKSIRLNEDFFINDSNVADKLAKGLIYMEDNIGDQIRDVMNSMGITKTENKKISSPLNQILFGPPGTGKTYNTINKALEIIHGVDYLKDKKREELVGEFNRLKDAGRIEFITFHQSFSYEDFVEGIKPVITQTGEEYEYVKTPDDKKSENGEIQYEIRAGIFKKMCEKAKGVRSDSKKQVGFVDFDKASYFKMSVGGKQKPHIHNWCIENNQLALGWGNDKDYSDLEKHVGNWKNFRDAFKKKHPEIAEESTYHITALYIFMKMKKRDIVLVSRGNKVIDAIGIIKDNKYIFDDTQDFGYYQFRNVEWIATGLNASADLFVTKNISQQSIYMLNEQDINKEYFKKEFSPAEKENAKENYVLIIDEINRGNVASIFGELITLIEEDKRMGTDNELFVRLPYSGSEGDLFGVPSNLHIIGTMNTADRSIEALDTALRRRFSFEEMLPKPELIKDGGLAPDGKIDDIDVVEMLQKINDRIEKLIDKDHMIGHSFFMNIKKEKAALVKVFQDKIIPLLEEYFYGDFGKIGLVLGRSFVEKVNTNGFEFAEFPEYDEVITDFKTRAVFRIAQKEKWDFISIYSKTAKDAEVNQSI